MQTTFILALALLGLWFLGKYALHLSVLNASYVRPGETMDYDPSTSAKIAGDIVQVDGSRRAGIVVEDIAANEDGSVYTRGIFDVSSASATVFAAGALVFWDATNKLAVHSGDYYLGLAIKAKTSGQLVVRIDLNAEPVLQTPFVDSADLLSGRTAQGTRATSATQNYPLGMKRSYADGRVFRYVKGRIALHTEFGACYAAKTITAAAAPAQGTGIGVVGAFTVKMTVASGDGLAANGAIAADELVGGSIVIGNGANQHPQNRRIVGNTVVAGGGGSCTVTLDEALDQVVTAGTTTIETLMNPWHLSDGNVTSSGYVTFRGMPACEIGSGEFGFAQTAGPCWITSDTHTCDSDGDRQIFFANNGSVVSGNDVTGDVNVQQLAGHAIDMSGSGASNAPFVNLCLEVS